MAATASKLQCCSQRCILHLRAVDQKQCNPSAFTVDLVDDGGCLRRLGQILVFSKIRAALGIMSTIVSGGGSLATHLDDFFEVCPMTENQNTINCSQLLGSLSAAVCIASLHSSPVCIVPCWLGCPHSLCWSGNVLPYQNEHECFTYHAGLVTASSEWLGPD